MSISSNKKQSGIALVELMLAVLFSMMMVAGGISVFSSSKQTLDLASAKSAIFDLSANIEKAFASRNTFSGLTSDVANNDLNVAPPTLANGIGPGGSSIDISTIAMDGIADGGYEFTITFSDASAAYPWCVNLLENTRGYWRETGPVGDVSTDHSVSSLTTACDGETVLVLRR